MTSNVYQESSKRPWLLSVRHIATAFLIATAVPSFAQATKETESNRHFIDAAFARWAAGGNGFFNEVLDENTVWTIKGSGQSAGVFRGRQAFVERAVKPFAARMSSPVKPVMRQVWADGEYVIARWDGEGVAGDGRAYKNSYVWIFRMSSGRVAEVTAFLDLAPYDDVLRRVPVQEDKR